MALYCGKVPVTLAIPGTPPDRDHVRLVLDLRNESGTGSDEFAAGYYLERDLACIPKVAAEYQLYDRWFCSIMASTRLFSSRSSAWVFRRSFACSLRRTW